MKQNGSLNRAREGAAKEADAPNNNLPAETTDFVGREKEIACISNLLGRARLVSLIGAGGIGKTRLSLKVACMQLDNYRDGVFFVPLAAVTYGDLLIATIAKTLGITELKGQPALNSIKIVLENKKLLIILDNFEQIVEEAAAVSELLAWVPQLSVLVTSRQPLNIYGEHLVYIPPLELPDVSRKQCLKALEMQPSVALFLSRARAVQCDFALTEENAGQVAELCACIEGIPLEIELAAANIGQIPIGVMLRQIKSRLSWMRNGARDLPHRHRSLRGTIEWGYNLLNEKQKCIFRRSGVFRGVFDSEAALRVMGAKDNIAGVSEELLDLVNKSIMTKHWDEKKGKLFFGMFETIREYAAELLSESEEEKYIRDCHSEYFLSVAVEAGKEMDGAGCGKWLEELDIAYPDVLEAFEHLKKTGSLEKELELAAAMSCYWDMRNYWDKAQAELGRIIESCAAKPGIKRLAGIYIWYGSFIDLRGHYERALQLYREGLFIAGQNGDSKEQAAIQYRMALTMRKIGDYVSAEKLMRESLRVYMENGHKQGAADVLRDLGQLCYFKGDYDQAERHGRESIKLSSETGDEYRRSKALGMLGLAARGKGDFEGALAMLRRYLASCEGLKDMGGMMEALMAIAEMARSQGHYDAAQEYYLRCLKFSRELGHMSIMARVLKELGEIARYRRDLKAASGLFEQSLAILKETGESGEEIWVYRSAAELELELDEPLKAEKLFLKGLGIYSGIHADTPIYVFLAIQGLAAVATALNQLDRAACLFGAADGLYKVIINLLGERDIKLYQSRTYDLGQKMEDSGLMRSWNEGKLMSIECALEYAAKADEYRYDKSMGNKMTDYIRKNYGRDISLNDISGYFNMSVSYLSTMFKYYTGRNFKDYLNAYRVEAAKELLKDGSLKIREVSKRVGCSNNVTFIRMFKKYEGTPPGEYMRGQIKNVNE